MQLYGPSKVNGILLDGFALDPIMFIIWRQAIWNVRQDPSEDNTSEEMISLRICVVDLIESSVFLNSLNPSILVWFL